jgi:hypothetical protein
VTTPGTTIENALNDALGAPGRRIEMADEINEIFAALFNQLVTQAFNGVGGLLGLTGSSGSSGSNPYYTNLYTQPPGAPSTEVGSLISDAIATEIEFQTLNEQIVAMLNDAAGYRERTYPGDSCHSGALPDDLQDQLTDANRRITEASAALAQLYQLQSQYVAAGSDPDLLRAVQQAFIDLQSSGILHSPSDNNMLETFGIPTLQDRINDFIADIDAVCPTNFGGGGV